MNTTYRMVEDPEMGTLEPVSVWKTKSFQRLALSAIGFGLIASLCGVFVLKSDVDDLQKNKIPVIESKIDQVR